MTADDLLAVNDRETAQVPVGDKTSYVRSLTAAEQIELDQAMRVAGEDVKALIVVQLAAYMSDETGKPLLSAEQAALFVERIKPATVQALLEKAGSLNGWTDKEKEAIRGN